MEKQKVVVLDPGHGGSDPGAVANGLQEKNLTWLISNLVKDKLAAYDVDVHIIQPSCTNPNSTKMDELRIPVQEANRLHADLMLSIHINAGGGEGYEDFVYVSAGANSEHYRDAIHQSVSKFFTAQGMSNRGEKKANFYVLRETDIPAVLVECGFIDNLKDAAKLKDSNFLDGLAAAIVSGLVKALGLTKKEIKPLVIINGVTLDAFMIDGRIYAPVRPLVEELGKSVIWHEETRTVTVE